MSEFNEVVLDLADLYHDDIKDVMNVGASEKTQLLDLLAEIYRFTILIGMDNQFKQSFPKIAFVVKHGSALQDALKKTSLRPREIKQAIMLMILIFSSSTKNLSPELVQGFEDVVSSKLTNERNIEATLMFFLSALHETFNPTKPFIFTKENFSINETLIVENALSACLGMYRVATSIDHDNIKTNLHKVFKLFYIYYSDIHILLPYTKFLEIIYLNLQQFKQDSRALRFFFECLTQTLSNLKNTALLNEGTIFRVKQLHPLLMVADMPKVIQSFYDDILAKTNDYIANLENYAKDLKDIFYYLWAEAAHLYELACNFDQSEVEIEDIQTFANKAMIAIQPVYFKYKVVPTKPLLAFLTPENSKNIFSNLLDSSGGLLKGSGLGGLFNMDTIKNIANIGFGPFNLGKFMDPSFIQKFIAFDFARLSKGVLFFWGTFAQSTDFQKLMKEGNTQQILLKFIEYLKDPISNLIRANLDKVPFGSQINMSNLSSVLDVALKKVKTTITKNANSSSSFFTSASDMVTDFAQSLDFGSGV